MKYIPEVAEPFRVVGRGGNNILAMLGLFDNRIANLVMGIDREIYIRNK